MEALRVSLAVAAAMAVSCGRAPPPGTGTPIPASPDAFALWGWSAEVDGVFGSNDDGERWESAGKVPGSAVAAARVGAAVVLISRTGAVFVTEDGGKAFRTSQVGTPGGGRAVTAFALGASTLYVGYGGGLYRSVDVGRTWLGPATGLPPNGSIDGIAEVDEVVLVASSVNGIHRSLTGAQSFTTSNSGLAAATLTEALRLGLVVFRGEVLALVQTLAGTGAPGGVYASSDKGLTWTARGTGLPATGTGLAWAMEERLLAAPEGAGLYVSRDGLSWRPACTGLPAAASVLKVSWRDDMLYLVTVEGNRGGFHVSHDEGETCTRGAQPSVSGRTAALSFVFAP